MIDFEEIKDEELEKVTGGTNITGDVNDNGEVYFKFPGLASKLSGWYNKESLEKLCNDNIGLAGLVKPYVNQDVRDAVASLYGSNIPASVQTMLG